MRIGLWVVSCVLSGVSAEASAAPLGVFLDCQSGSRTRACPSFFRSYIDETEHLVATSQADADVALFVNQTVVANDDRIHLRFVSRRADGLQEFELLYDLDTRDPVEDQRVSLRPTFLRGIAPFLAQHAPEAVDVSLSSVPSGSEAAEGAGSPWWVSFGGDGSVDWSENATNANVRGNIQLGSLTAKARWGVSAYGGSFVQRQPPLVIEGEEISLDQDTWDVRAEAHGSYNVAEFWSVGVISAVGASDPESRYVLWAGGEAGVSRDFFPADDPRGNRLAISALVGVQCDWYQRKNVLGQEQTCFPTARLSSSGSVTLDTLSFWAGVTARIELTHPGRRYEVWVSPGMSVRLGPNVDLNLGVGVTQQAIPGPAELDQASFEEVTRNTWAVPLRLSSWAGFRIHFDRTNGQRNDRFFTGWGPSF